MDDLLVASLERPRFELIPMRSAERALAALPGGADVSVTANGSRGLEPTLELTERLAALGHHAVPHLAARMVEGPAHLRAIVDRLRSVGVTAIFVPAGDVPEAAGPYEGAADLLEGLAGMDHPFAHIGVTGYPERHPFISDALTISEMQRKADAGATEITTQMCFDTPTIVDWVAAVRARGITLPIRIGVPGVVDRVRLVRISLQVGLGDSIRYLSKQPDLATKMLLGYEPDTLMRELSPLLADGRIVGWHIFTFNEMERTEMWRKNVLTDLAARTA